MLAALLEHESVLGHSAAAAARSNWLNKPAALAFCREEVVTISSKPSLVVTRVLVLDAALACVVAHSSRRAAKA